LPVAKVAGFRQPETGRDANLSSLVTEAVEPSDKILGLANREHVAL
jgi:hypothetical protein